MQTVLFCFNGFCFCLYVVFGYVVEMFVGGVRCDYNVLILHESCHVYSSVAQELSFTIIIYPANINRLFSYKTLHIQFALQECNVKPFKEVTKVTIVHPCCCHVLFHIGFKEFVYKHPIQQVRSPLFL